MLDEPTLRAGIVLRVCCGPTCGKRSEALTTAARRQIDREKLASEVAVAQQYCFGRCMLGPNVLVERWADGGPDNAALHALAMGQQHPAMSFEGAVAEADIPGIVDRHLAAWREET